MKLENLGRWGSTPELPDSALRRDYLAGIDIPAPGAVLRAFVLVPPTWTLADVRAVLQARGWHEMHASLDVRAVALARMGF